MPLFPFSVFAESVGGSSPIIGVNITYVEYDGEVVPYQTTVHFDTEQTMWRCTSSHSTMGCQVWESENINGSTLDEITGTITTNATSTYTYRLYQYEFIFDKSYVGSITFNGNHPGATTTTTYYVNGNRLVLTDINLVTSFTIGSYSLTYAPLEVLDMMRQWRFPQESLSQVSNMYALNYTEVDMFNNSYWEYPMFYVPSGSLICQKWFTQGQVDYLDLIIIKRGGLSYSNFTNIFTLSNCSLWSITELMYSNTYCIFKIKLDVRNLGSNFASVLAATDLTICPIYFQYSDWKYNSTDFALVYGLNNQLIDDLHFIAQGTSASTSSSNDLENSADDIIQNSNTMFNFENQQNTNMNNALQNINTNFDIGTIGSSFLTSAAWVKTQFDNLTNTTPFGSVLSFSLLLGLALLIIGKVYK